MHAHDKTLYVHKRLLAESKINKNPRTKELLLESL